MSPFDEVLDVGYLRAGLFGSLGCDPGGSIEEAAANMVVAWPKLAALWPSYSPGREIVALGLLDGVRERPFRGMEYPPLLAAVRWCLLTQRVAAFEMRPDSQDMFLPHSSDVYRNMGVRLYHSDGLPECGAFAARRGAETVMREAIGATFTDLMALSTETIPYISRDWKHTYHLSWHLPTDRMSTVLSVSRRGGLSKETHRFELSSSSGDHLDRFIALVTPLTEEGTSCTSS